jgi:microcystin degradation protein MlrC
MHKPRIAILGFAIECNRFAPVATGADFRARVVLEGERLLAEVRKETPATTPEIPAFVRRMDAIGDWSRSILLANAESGRARRSPLLLDARRVSAPPAAGPPLDAVYICEHGAAITTAEDDPDGLVFQTVREVVGGSVPVVATIDLHANVSDRMVDLVDLLISYRRNPHTDMAERGADAADALHELIEGMRVAVAHIRMPIVAPPTQLLTAPGSGPYAEMIARGEALADPRILNVSIVGGFAYGDTPKNGLTVLVSTRNDAALAQQTARDLASLAWRERAAFVPALTSLDEAAAPQAFDPDRPWCSPTSPTTRGAAVAATRRTC